MTAKTKTPQELDIARRDYQFGRNEPHPKWWMGGDPIATAFFNALSSLFPLGERFFMDSVKAFRDRTDGKLKEQVADFLYQEAMHTREHVFFNKMATDAGYNIKPLEDRAARILGWARTKQPIMQLAATCALEHFTAMLAHEALENPAHLKDTPPEARDMWRWHAMEEIEHKAVAFDVFQKVAGGGYFTRIWSFLHVSIMFPLHTLLIMRHMLQVDGQNTWKNWFKGLWWLYGKGGLWPRLMPHYFAYFKPGFHPWKHGDLKAYEIWDKAMKESGGDYIVAGTATLGAAA